MADSSNAFKSSLKTDLSPYATIGQSSAITAHLLGISDIDV